MAQRISGLTLAEIVDILNDPLFEDLVSHGQDPIDVVVCPPNVDTLTDDAEGSDDVIGIVDVQDVPGTLEIHYASYEACES